MYSTVERRIAHTFQRGITHLSARDIRDFTGDWPLHSKSPRICQCNTSENRTVLQDNKTKPCAFVKLQSYMCG